MEDAQGRAAAKGELMAMQGNQDEKLRELAITVYDNSVDALRQTLDRAPDDLIERLQEQGGVAITAEMEAALRRCSRPPGAVKRPSRSLGFPYENRFCMGI